ncbi:MAG TPA: hypothetical protein VKA94_07190 [Hyphomicrobiales bacterium]|nr:hypothetical protein [Hyphomicrobiales bacterium]
MKRFILLTIAAFAVFSIGVQISAAAPLQSGDRHYSFKPDGGLLLEARDRKKRNKKRKTGADILGGPAYWGYGPYGPDNPCKKCAERCSENPNSARCKRCKARCE